MNPLPQFAVDALSFLPQWAQMVTWYGVVALVLFIIVILMMAFLTLAERRVLGVIQARIGPNRVGPWGIGQPFADVIKLILKEIVIPSNSSRFLFLIAPLLSLIPALAAWAVVPLWPGFAVADINAGLLYLLALSSAGVYGVILAGWATNSKYALLGAMRAAAQMVAYEIAMGFALVGVVMASQSLNLGEIIEGQRGGPLSFYWFWLLPLFGGLLHLRPRRDESRAVRRGRRRVGNRRRLPCRVFGHGVCALLRRRIRQHDSDLGSDVDLLLRRLALAASKVTLTCPPSWRRRASTGSCSRCGSSSICFLWFRATFPRYRYDQIMRLGWKVFIPVTLVWISVEGDHGITKSGRGRRRSTER